MGVVTTTFGIAGFLVDGVAVGAQYVLLGGAFATMGAAELVRRDRIEAARNLRSGSLVAFVLYATWVFGPPFLAASHRTKLVAVAGLLFSTVFGVLIYEILNH